MRKWASPLAALSPSPASFHDFHGCSACFSPLCPSLGAPTRQPPTQPHSRWLEHTLSLSSVFLHNPLLKAGLAAVHRSCPFFSRLSVTTSLHAVRCMSETTSTSTSAADHAALQFSLEEVVAGGAAGFAEHFLMFPCDTVKTRMQGGRARSIRHVVRHVWNHERLTHLYRGCVPVLVSAIPAHGVYFSVYEALKRLFGKDTNVAIAVAASFATVAHDSVSTPFDVVKQRMQMDQRRCFTTSVECARRIVRSEGIGALFASLPTTVVMNIPHFSAYWLAYEGFLASRGQGSVRHREDEVTVDYLAAGFVAGACAAVVSFPFDTVKTHLQLGHALGFRHTLRELIRQRGIRGVFSGVVPRILYTAPSGAIMMTTYETVKNALAFERSIL
ncbi:hypothetical protein GH5_03849 [Leishmania sp. Ghana 2012 LV757]|uniref:hypothetical protein n=1 Tax=Leishmania sp. Ghana 2012 LV757 TaxID=2803181 RepID=UPI001B5BCFB3|nr:hypothetical protein GH5_03849 [Leishmania sp. Ghana 2012 LV757]